jgi:hypothetical protein
MLILYAALFYTSTILEKLAATTVGPLAYVLLSLAIIAVLVRLARGEKLI